MKTNQTLRFLKDRKNILNKVTLKSCLLLLLFFGMIINASAQQYQRVYANTEQHSAPQKLLLLTLSSVVSPSDAVDGNPFTKDTLSTSIGALALIQATQNLQFTGADKPAPNTPVTLKIGFGSSVLNLLGGITVQATLNGVGVGTKYSGGELAVLLGGTNMSEVTFTPGVAYDGVKVTVTPILGVGVTASLYGAYFLKPATSTICSAVPIDELDGVGKYLSGVNLANFAGDVVNPMNVLDGNENTFATVNASVGVAAYTQETVIFASPSSQGDSAGVIISNPGGLLNLGVLQNSIQILTYDGNTGVDSVAGNTSLLTLQLLQGPGNKVAVRFKSKGIFDRIQFRLGGVANVLPSINLYEMEMVAPAPTINIGGSPGDSATICSDSTITLSVANPESGATYYWEDPAGTQIATGTSYQFTSGKAPGTYKYYVKEFRAACTTAYDSAEAVVNVELAQKPTIILPTKDTTISQGQSVTLKAFSSQSGATINWYTSSAGGTPIRTGQDTIHVTPDNTTTYYAETALGSCTSATRAAIVVNVLPALAAPEVVPDTAYVTIGQTATFRIVNVNKTLGYGWFTTPSGSSSISSDTTYTTGTIQADSNYYVEAMGPGGNVSTRTHVVVIALQPPASVFCNTPNAQVSPVITGLCLLCEVYNPGNAIDADSTTASNIRGTVGLLGTVGQLLKFQHTGKSGDSIAMTLATNTGLLDLGLLNGVSVVFYENGQAVGTYGLNDALLHLRLLQGVNKSYVTIVAPVDYDGMEIRIGGVATALTSIYVYYVQQLYPMPTVTTDTVAICPGDKATLTAALPSGSTDVIGWFSAAVGGTLLNRGTDYTTPVLSDTTIYYVTSARVMGTDTCWNLNRIPAVVNVGTPEPPAVVSDSVQVCLNGNVKLQVSNPLTGYKYIWYSTATGGTALDTATSYAVNNVMKDTAYYVGLMNTGGCISTSRTKVNVISTNSITPPVLSSDTITATIGQAVTFSIGQADTINFTYRWYADSTTTTILSTGATYTPPAYGSTGTYSYFVDALAKSGCLSNGRRRATAIISGVTAAPCNTPNAQTSPVISGICLLCEVYNPGNAIDADSMTASNIRGTVGLLGTVGQLLKFQHTGKSGDSIAMTLATNTGLLDLGLLNGVSVVFYQNGQAVGTYALNDALLHLRLLQGVNKSYITIVAPVDYDGMEIRIGGVATALTSIYVYYVQQLYPMPTVTTDTATICYGDSTSFTATPAPNTIVGWYASSTGGTVLSTNSIFTTPALTHSVTYYVTAARVTGTDTCWNTNRLPLTVIVNPRSRAVDIEISGADTICTGEISTLQASSKTVTDSIFSWYSDETLKNKLFTGSIFKVSPTATTTYYVAVLGTGFCENAPDSGKAVTIKVNPRADSMDITVKGDTVCLGEQATLQASSTVVPNGIFTWYSDPKLTNKLYTGASYTISPTNVTTYYVTVQGNGFCENAPDSAKSVTVVVNPRAKASDINMNGPDTICAGEQATLQASSTVVPNPIFNWYSDAKLTNKLYTGASYSINPSGTATYYVTVLGTGFCENLPGSGRSVTIVVNPRAQASDIEISGGSTICEGDTVTLTASSKTISNAIFTWYSDSQLKNKLSTGTTFKVTPDVTTTYYVTAQGNGFCENAPGNAQTVTMTVNPVPKTPVVSGPTGAICANTTATLEVTNAQAGVTYNWYSVATGGTALATGTTYTTAALQATITYYVAAAVTGGCASTSGRTSVTVTVNQVPEPPKVQATDVTVCIGSNATFEVASPQTGIIYNWYTAPTGGTPLTSGTTFTTSPLQSDSAYYVEAEATGGCSSASRTQVNAKVVGLPPAPTVNLSANPVCPDSTVTLTASSGVQGVTYKWYDSPTNGHLLFTGNPYTTPPLTATTTYYVEAINAGGCANPGGRTSVTVVVLMQLPAPQVSLDTATTNSVTFAWGPVPGAVGYQVSTDNGTTWQQPSSGAIGLKHIVTGLQLNQSVTIIVKALAQSSCQNSQPSQAVTGTSKGSPLGDYIFVPNAFSPNGDGLNDVWKVYGNNISKLQVMVYNQYGQKIFESHSQQDGWDGTYQGKKQPVGVYVYYLQMTFTDGKTETKKGDINLIR